MTGIRRARGFTYINLNNGDSWAYYFLDSNPEIVRSFKHDPPVRLADIAPGLVRAAPAAGSVCRGEVNRSTVVGRRFSSPRFRSRHGITYSLHGPSWARYLVSYDGWT